MRKNCKAIFIIIVAHKIAKKVAKKLAHKITKKVAMIVAYKIFNKVAKKVLTLKSQSRTIWNYSLNDLKPNRSKFLFSPLNVCK